VHAVTARGRWVWALSGLVTAAVLAVPGVRLLARPGLGAQRNLPTDTITRSFSESTSVTSLNVQSQSGPVRVQAGSGRDVQVIERISFSKSAEGVPPVHNSVTGGRLTLGDPVCATADCSVSFQVTVPSSVSVTVTSNGGIVAVSGVAGADVDSGGAPATLTHISGPLTANTDGGALQVSGLSGNLHADTGGGPLSATRIDGMSVISTGGGALVLDGLTGPLQADTGGGPASARDLDTRTATITTGGGSGQVMFAAAPDSVTLSTDGGPAALEVPGGPYALSVSSDGGPESVSISTDPSASRTLAVTSGGGSLMIGPASGVRSVTARAAVRPVKVPRVSRVIGPARR
jgi:hypothetical protein